MISHITSKYQINYKPLTKTAPTFTGDKDILIIDEDRLCLSNMCSYVKGVLGQKAQEYKIYEALGGEDGLEKAKQYNPFLTITAYNMRQYPPNGVDLIKSLKKLGTKVIVVTSNWWRYGIESMKAGAKKCEEEAGADKYITECYLSRENFNSSKDYELYSNNYTPNKVLFDSVKAMINGTPIPKYPFQNDSKEETNK